MHIFTFTLISVFSPALGALIAGLGKSLLKRNGAEYAAIFFLALSFLSATCIFWQVLQGQSYNGILYNWVSTGSFTFDIGFQIDSLSSIMILMVTFISLLVHIYSLGYMANDPGRARFFAYMSLFTFMMILLVSANNFFQLFLGWEGVGLSSYLLIGFWFYKESAAQGSLKAFLVNRAGDFGFLLGIAAVLDYFGSLDYQSVFAQVPSLIHTSIQIFPHTSWSVLSVICILLFIGAMGKSAQIPLHVWLPESMEGPTPISALIHAATMVTAGVFMVARLSPMFEFSQTALSFVLIVGSTSALFLGLLAFVEFDLKRVIAYSTMSQLGYMMAANGVSVFQAGIFHLLTHACFKALLFLAAGSVIIALHHEQDLRKMGNLRKHLPLTHITFLIGALALAAVPPFSGFFSKDAIIEAVHYANIPGASYAYVCLLMGAFVTAYYIFRAFFMAFYGEERFDVHLKNKVKEPGPTIRWPLIILSVPTVLLGFVLAKFMLYGEPGFLSHSVFIASAYKPVLNDLVSNFDGVWGLIASAPAHLSFWFSLLGIFSAGFMVLIRPRLLTVLHNRFNFLYRILVNKYGFDLFNDWFFVRGAKKLSQFFYRFADLKMIDDFMVEGSGRYATRLAELFRKMQSGYLYHYVLIMVVAVLSFLVWMLI